MKKLTALFLALVMLLSLCTVTAFADGTTYDITNGTSESDNDKNHGYITIDKATATDGETVTVTVKPNEGYQLKSLTVTTKTIADVLATAENDFPQTTTEDNVPDNHAWQASGTDWTKYCCLTYDGNSLYFYCLEGKDISKNAPVSQDSGNYIYTDGTITITFNMTGEVLSSIEFADTETDTWDGEYFPQSECIAAGTMISMPGGTQKAVEELEIGDVICTFDHETGEVSSAPVAFIWESKNVGNAFTLTFEDDIEVTVIEEHGFYDKEEQKYVFINLQNAEEYIGHRFYNADTNSWPALKSCEALNESVDAYAIITSGHLNHMSNGMLSMCDGSVKVFANIFEYDDQMKFDADKKKADIEAYGLTSKEKILELKGFTETDYDDYNLQYVDVMIGKGLITWEDMEALSDYCVANGLVDIYSGSEAAEENEAPKMLLMSATAPKNLLGSAPALTAQDGIEIKANEDGTYQFTMPAANVTVSAVFEIAHVHTYAEAWSTDATNHWHAATCGHDTEKDSVGNHVDEDVKDHKCDVCGYVMSECKDENGDGKCDICGKDMGKPIKPVKPACNPFATLVKATVKTVAVVKTVVAVKAVAVVKAIKSIFRWF